MNRKLLASAICASLLVSGVAYAQDNAAPQQSQDQTATTQNNASSQQEKKEEPKTLEKVSVTGSLLKRPEYQTTVPVQVVNIQAQEAAGLTNISGFLQQSAVAAGSTQINGQFGGFVMEGGTGVKPIDLRGLGAQRTLVLLDGQRPGPAGTRGAVNNFDLNVIPRVIIGRIEIVKDGSSSIYGSDAIAGVVNLITKKRLDKTEMEFFVSSPEHGGGEHYQASLGTGWNFNNGNFTFAVEADRQNELKAGQRDFLACSQPRVYSMDGQRVDWPDHSILAGTPLGGCQNMLIDTLINAASGLRYVPSKDGSTSPGVPVPGFIQSQRKTYAQSPNGAFNDQPYNFAQYGQSYMLDRTQNLTGYLATSFNFGDITWDTQLLVNRRTTRVNRFRQFFPVVSNDNGWSSGDFGLYVDSVLNKAPIRNAWEPVMLFPSNDRIRVDYGYLRTGLNGGFGNSSWTWAVNANFSRSSGDYDRVGINLANSGDWNDDGNELEGRTLVNYFDPGFLDGSKMNELVGALGQFTHGNTVYQQQDVNAVVNGNLFELPAGPLAAAFGAEYRHYSINDMPPPATWGFTAAGNTRGTDQVNEVFGELGVPLLKGLPAVDSLSVDLSAREFRYGSVGKSAHVWKYGLNWQPIPSFRVRGSIGTSYRAPGLFELYLANETGFTGQLGIDPCINWAESSNQFVQQNCAAAGIPDNYTGTGPTAKITRTGGKGFLTPETSRAKSLGFVWSPTFANLNVAVDYFDYHIRGEIATLGGGTIVTSCYNKPVYPNAFCGFFQRNPATGPNPYNITNVTSVFLNVDQERDRGYDLQVNYAQDFGFGRLSVDGQVTYTMQHIQQIFSSSEASGFGVNDFTGTIGNPRFIGIANVGLKRGDWMYNYQAWYTSATSDNRFEDPVFTYLGRPDTVEVIRQGAQVRHTVSATYNYADKIGIQFGIRNLTDRTPPLVSNTIGTENVRGNVVLQASQYDWFGRTYFARLNVKL